MNCVEINVYGQLESSWQSTDSLRASAHTAVLNARASAAYSMAALLEWVRRCSQGSNGEEGKVKELHGESGLRSCSPSQVVFMDHA
jgi:hypothetical protein